MQNIVTEKQQREAALLEAFINMVKSPDGDFEALEHLFQAASDRYSLQLIIDVLSQEPQGERAFQERPRLGNVDLEALHKLPKTTLGYHYAVHMLSNNLKVLSAKEVPDGDLAFLAVHTTETHDCWHVVTGCSTHITGEIELEAFYVAQMSASRFWLALLAKNLLKSTLQEIETSGDYMDALCRGWLRGKQAKPLFGIEWNKLWETPLAEVRDRLNLNRVPETASSLST